jgi:hypothetical protein
VIEIATFLDNDIKQRPPPPPVLKAYVRRAAAQAELGRCVAPPINCDAVPRSAMECDGLPSSAIELSAMECHGE